MGARILRSARRFQRENSCRLWDGQPKVINGGSIFPRMQGSWGKCIGRGDIELTKLFCGCGSFPAAIKNIEKLNLRGVLLDVAAADDKYIMGVCLGMQLLCRSSDEED